jgi:hypothetical protein
VVGHSFSKRQNRSLFAALSPNDRIGFPMSQFCSRVYNGWTFLNATAFQPFMNTTLFAVWFAPQKQGNIEKR